MAKVTNMTNEKGRAVANQFIIFEGNTKTFQSYETLICSTDHDDDILNLVLHGDNWDYSNTTRKYFKRFINEETRFHYENKAQWLKEIENNKNIRVV
jgi:hypothetical protein